MITWQEQVQLHLVRHQCERALRVLDRITTQAMGLFRDDPRMREDARLAWHYRVNILCEAGRLPEALAWTCLECELSPDHVAAHAMRIRLRTMMGIGAAAPQGAGPPPAAKGLWPGVAGMREVKAMLERNVILPLQQPELYRRYRLDLPNGILLHGPPGCGKTFIARKLAQRLSFEFIEAKPSDLASIYVHGGQEKIGALFAQARASAPTLIFFDELDALMPDRGAEDVSHHYAAEVNEFLVQLNDARKNRILVIGATNLLKKVDPAVLRPGRMDKKIFVGPPDLEARVDLLRTYMHARPQCPIDWLDLARACPFYTAAELEHVVNEAARAAIAAPRSITCDDLLAALSSNPPSLTLEAIESMRSP